MTGVIVLAIIFLAIGGIVLLAYVAGGAMRKDRFERRQILAQGAPAVARILQIGHGSGSVGRGESRVHLLLEIHSAQGGAFQASCNILVPDYALALLRLECELRVRYLLGDPTRVTVDFAAMGLLPS